MSEKPSGSARTDLLLMVLQMGQFEKNSEVHNSWEGCVLCDKKFRSDAEVIFCFPRKVSLSGTDLPFDITTETGKLCLPCLIKLGDALPGKALQEVMAYAKNRYAKDTPKVYVPEALAAPDAPDAGTTKA